MIWVHNLGPCWAPGPKMVPNSPPGLKIRPRVQIWGWFGPRLARGASGAPKWGPKNMVLWRNGFENGDYGISRDPNEFYGTQEAFGNASFSPTPSKEMVFPTFPGFREIGGGSPWPPVYLLWAL